jgi:hypothetical protein
MARAKRRGNRSSTSTATPSSVSPIFSSQNSVHSETPLTSDNENDAKETVVSRVTRSANKRTAQSDDDAGMTDQDKGQDTRPKKRRAIVKTAYVQVPVSSRAKAKKFRALMAVPLTHPHLTDIIRQGQRKSESSASTTRWKRRGSS